MASDFIENVKRGFANVSLPISGQEPVVYPEQSPLERMAYPEQARIVAVPVTDNAIEAVVGKRMVPVGAPEGMDGYEFSRLLGAAYNVFLRDGVISPEHLSEMSGVAVARCYWVLDQEEFATALALRGIDLQNRKGLTPEQDHALLIIGDTTSKDNFNTRLRKAGVSQAKLRAWLKNPVFKRAYNGLAEATAENYEVAMLELGRRAGEGDLKAIEKSLAISGRYSEDTQTRIDMMAFMGRVVEIISVRLAGHPDILNLIAQDLSNASQQTLEHGKPINGDVIPAQFLEGATDAAIYKPHGADQAH